jgi:hypothetical protein
MEQFAASLELKTVKHAPDGAPHAVMTGAPLGPLHGLPIAIKDLYDFKAGVRNTFSAKPLASYVPHHDGTYVHRLQAAGAIVLGKANTPEFGHKGAGQDAISAVLQATSPEQSVGPTGWPPRYAARRIDDAAIIVQGRVKPHQRVLIRALLDHIAFLESSIAALDTEVAQALVLFTQAMALLQSLPGVTQTAAAALIAEPGVDMSRFPSAKHVAS